MLIALLIVAYFLGSIPFGLLLTQWTGQGDLRKVGSGNIGATNVLRTGNRRLAALTLLLDGAKGFIAVLTAQRMGVAREFVFLTGLLAVLGHIFPVWLKFRGGKGVATAIGVILGISYGMALSVIAIWLLVFILSRISSLAALSSFGINCLVAGLMGVKGGFYFMVMLTAILCYTHRQNIKRLRNGTEPAFKIGGK